jgi:type IV pilus assembly protein PilP
MKYFILFCFGMILFNAYGERIKEELEFFEIKQIKVESITITPISKFANVISPNGKNNIVKIGNYMGKNYGRVMEINPKFIKIREVVRTHKKDEWVERDIIIAVTE